MLQNIVNIVSAWRLRSPEQLSQDFTETDWARFALFYAVFMLFFICFYTVFEAKSDEFDRCSLHQSS